MNNDAFAGFYERSARSLWAYLARVSGDPALADDSMQESLCALSLRGAAARWRSGRAPLPFPHRHQSSARSLARAKFPVDRGDSRRDVCCDQGHAASPNRRRMLGPALAQHASARPATAVAGLCRGICHREIAEVTGLASASIRLLLFRARHKTANLLREGAKKSRGAR